MMKFELSYQEMTPEFADMHCATAIMHLDREVRHIFLMRIT